MDEREETLALLHTLKKRLPDFYTQRNNPAPGVEFEKIDSVDFETLAGWGQDLQAKAAEISGIFNILAPRRNPDIQNPALESLMPNNRYYRDARQGFYQDCRELQEILDRRGVSIQLLESQPLVA